MAVLALDLASKSGWALYEKNMQRPFSGSELFKRPTGTNGEALEKLRKLMADQHAMHGLTDIVFEAQHISDQINPQTVYLLIGMGAMVEWFGHRIGARTFPVDIGTWRKHFLGKGSFKQAKDAIGVKRGPTGRQQAKAKSIDACNSLGWFPKDDNAADALGVLDYYLSLPPIARMYPRPWRDLPTLKATGPSLL